MVLVLGALFLPVHLIKDKLFIMPGAARNYQSVLSFGFPVCHPSMPSPVFQAFGIFLLIHKKIH